MSRRDYSPTVNQTGCLAEYSPPASAQFNSKWAILHVPPAFMTWCLIKHTGGFNFLPYYHLNLYVQKTIPLMVPVSTKVHKHICAHSFPHINKSRKDIFCSSVGKHFQIQVLHYCQTYFTKFWGSTQGCTILDTWLPGWLNFAQQCLIFLAQLSQLLSLHTKICISSYAQSIKCQTTVRFTGHSRTVGPRYGTWFMPPFRHLEFGCDSEISEKFMYIWINLYHMGMEDFRSPCTIQPVAGFNNRGNSITIKHTRCSAIWTTYCYNGTAMNKSGHLFRHIQLMWFNQSNSTT